MIFTSRPCKPGCRRCATGSADLVHPDGLSAAAPCAGCAVDHTWKRRAAGRAAAEIVQPPIRQQVPVAPDHPRAAPRAIAGLRLDVMGIAYIDMPQPGRPGDTTRAQ